MIRLRYLALIAVCATILSAQQPPVTALYFVRQSGGFGGGPQDSLMLSATGEARYYGDRNVSHMGAWRGTIDSSTFDSLAAWILPELPFPTPEANTETTTSADSAPAVPLTVQSDPACSDAPKTVIAATVGIHTASNTYGCRPPRFAQETVARLEAVIARIQWTRAD
jgi:hypothetical protein